MLPEGFASAGEGVSPGRVGPVDAKADHRPGVVLPITLLGSKASTAVSNALA